MSTGLKFKINSDSSIFTEKLGEIIGSNLKGGEVIELSSDLGGGKTTFVRGLSRGAGSEDHVSSPTFTISKVYKTSNFEINHFDFYRLNEPGLIKEELSEIFKDTNSVTIIEWAGIIKDILPEKTFNISIQYKAENSRLIAISYNENTKYLLAGI